MEQQIRFCKTSDGVRIAYATVGEGPPLLWVTGWISHLELDWQLPLLRPMWEAFAQHFTLVRLDKRGTGLSDRNLGDYSLEARVRDLEAVVDHLKLRSCSLAGWSESGPTCMAYAVRHPRRVSRMALYGTFARGERLWGSQELREAVKSVVKAEWGLGSKLLSDLFLGETAQPEQAQLFANYQQLGATAEDAYASMEGSIAINVAGLLPQVKVPTLIVHARGDRVVPIELGRELAAGIPGARFVSIDGPHVPGTRQQAEQLREAFLSFLLEGLEAQQRPPDPAKPVDARPITIMFTDMEGSTGLTQRLGDAKAQELLRAHNSIVRDALKAHAGSEIKHTGDGIMASFASASGALECAIAIQRAFAERNRDVGAHSHAPLHEAKRKTSLPARPEALVGRAEPQPPAADPIRVRIGLNAGEPVAEDADLFGTAVQLAARVCAQAQPAQILVPEGVRHLVAGKGFLFSDQGDVALRGFEDPVRLYEVRWREDG